MRQKEHALTCVSHLASYTVVLIINMITNDIIDRDGGFHNAGSFNLGNAQLFLVWYKTRGPNNPRTDRDGGFHGKISLFRVLSLHFTFHINIFKIC